jgi:hypothetical protein
MSKWRERYQTHPAADAFPMMSDAELGELGEDIRKHGLRQPICLFVPPGTKVDTSAPVIDGCILIDGRNRLEAMERAGIDVVPHWRLFHKGDPVRIIVSLNLQRRHLSKQERADLIVEVVRASRQVGEVTPKRHVEGKAGSEKDPEKAKAVEVANEYGISKRTIERSLGGPKARKSKPPTNIGLKVARDQYAAEFAKLPVREEQEEFKRLGAAINRARDER